MIKAELSGEFAQKYEDLIGSEPNLKKTIFQHIKWFKQNPNDTRLDNHHLTGRMEGKWAFSISDDIRIVYEWLGKNTVRFLAIGDHKKVYRTS